MTPPSRPRYPSSIPIRSGRAADETSTRGGVPHAARARGHDHARVEVRTGMSGETARPVLVRGGLVADGIADDLLRADVRVAGDRVVEIGPDLPPDGSDVIDAGWQLVMPGFVDTHVHVDAL